MVVDELQAKRPGSRPCAEWLVRSILYKHARLSDHRQVAPWRLAEVSPAVTYVSNHYAEPCSIETLAQLCNMSVSTLRRKFYSALECAPSDYIHRVRIGAATVMLSAENKSILEICHQVGYMSLSSFNRQFRKLTGESPREMRNRMRKSRHPPFRSEPVQKLRPSHSAKAKASVSGVAPHTKKCVSRLGNALIFKASERL